MKTFYLVFLEELTVVHKHIVHPTALDYDMSLNVTREDERIRKTYAPALNRVRAYCYPLRMSDSHCTIIYIVHVR